MQNLFITNFLNGDKSGFDEIVRTLLRHGAEVNMKTDENKTALHIAIENGHLDVVITLLQNGAVVDEGVDVDKNGILHKVISKENLEAMKLLLKIGANVNGLDSKGRTPLEVATGCGNVTMISYLLDHGADTEIKTSFGSFTVLIIACLDGNIEVMTKLLDHGAKVDARGMEEKTPLHIATFIHTSKLENSISFYSNITTDGFYNMSDIHL